ncbi:GTP-binding protein, partial [Pseudomonadota bacterium]
MNPNIRNIAVIAHVDHGKTTLIDALLKQTNVFRDNQQEMNQEQILDSNDLERERGITILAKNCSINYKNTKINIIDTPGHADFSGEVERTLGMADGALLIIDAQEGPMPQTRFVLKTALALNLKIIVVINKIDKKNAVLTKTESNIDDLFLELAATEEQLNFPKLYSIARDGKVFSKMPATNSDFTNTTPLLETILESIPAPTNQLDGPFKLNITSLDYDNHLGRIVIGKVHQGKLSTGDKLIVTNTPEKKFTAEKIMIWNGLSRTETITCQAGDIVAITGIPDAQIGHTISDPSDTQSLDSQTIGEPTLHISLGPNTSPFVGREGKFTTSRQIEERLNRELESNIGLKVEKQESNFKISGRGELHLSILLETMRREGYEMQVGKPQVIVREKEGIKQEPIEELSIIVPNEHQGIISQEIGKRLGQLLKMDPITEIETEFIYEIPSRATIGLRGVLLN